MHQKHTKVLKQKMYSFSQFYEMSDKYFWNHLELLGLTHAARAKRQICWWLDSAETAGMVGLSLHQSF